LKCSKLRNKSDRDSLLYSSYPYMDASDADKKVLIHKPKGEWRTSTVMQLLDAGTRKGART
jgi:hypothetical protein